MVRKSRKGREDWKIMGNVFDNFTGLRIQKFITEGHFEGLYSPISIGKEANIFSAKRKDGSFVIVKIYRLENCNFNKMYDYIKEDERYLNLKKRRREIIFAWTQREFRNLMLFREAGVRVPTPIALKDHLIVMEYIGQNGNIAREIKDDMPNNPKEFYQKIKENMRKLYKKALVHGDLSKFNILNLDQSPVFIDLSQSTTINSYSAREMLDRDVKNIINFFNKLGVNATEEEMKKDITKK